MLTFDTIQLLAHIDHHLIKAYYICRLYRIPKHTGGVYVYPRAYIIENGYFELIKQLRQINKLKDIDRTFLKIAIKNGHFNIIKWLHSLGYNYDNRLLMKSWNTEFKHITRWMFTVRVCDPSCEDYVYPDYDTLVKELTYHNAYYCAIGCNDVEKIKWAHLNTPELFSGNTLPDAVMSNSLDVAEWLYENRNDGFNMQYIDVNTYGWKKHDISIWFHAHYIHQCKNRDCHCHLQAN